MFSESLDVKLHDEFSEYRAARAGCRVVRAQRAINNQNWSGPSFLKLHITKNNHTPTSLIRGEEQLRGPPTVPGLHIFLFSSLYIYSAIRSFYCILYRVGLASCLRLVFVLKFII